MRSAIWAVLAVGLIASTTRADEEDTFLRQSRGANHPKDIDEWRKGEKRNGLKPYPNAPPGTPNPAGGLSQFGGGSPSSFSGPDLGMPRFYDVVADSMALSRQRIHYSRVLRIDGVELPYWQKIAENL